MEQQYDQEEKFDLDEYISTLSGIPEVDIRIINYLDDDDLFNICTSNNYTASLCRGDDLWKERLQGKHDIMTKPENLTWREFYIILSYARLSTKGQRRFYELLTRSTNWEVFSILARFYGFQFLLDLIRYKRLDILKGLMERGILQLPSKPDLRQSLGTIAVRFGNVDILDWLAQHNIFPTQSAANTAVHRGNASIVQWLLEHGYNIRASIRKASN